MSDLRIGQRCRLVNVRDAANRALRHCEGDEVTILGLPGSIAGFPDHYEISCPQGFPFSRQWHRFGAPRENLRPLTDPGADAFMERIKRLIREPINEVSKEIVE